MKIRNDFVTNSSSSSFIISTRAAIPEGYETNVDKITKETIIKVLERLSYELDLEENISYEVDDKKLTELGNFTDEQLIIIRLIQSEQLALYLDVKQRLEKGEKLYHIMVDRDWYYNQDELQRFVNASEMINEEYDL